MIWRDIERDRAARKPIGNLQHHPERDDEAERRRYGGKDQKAFHAGRPWLLILGPNRSAASFVAAVTPRTLAGAAGRTRMSEPMSGAGALPELRRQG